MEDVTNLIRDKIGSLNEYTFIMRSVDLTNLFLNGKLDILRNYLTDFCQVYAHRRLRGGCFLPQTLVTCADKTQVAISAIKPGDSLLAFNDGGEIVTTIVQEVLIRTVDEYIELEVGEDNKVSITPDHWVYVDKKSFTQLKNLRINDTLFVLSTVNNTCDLNEKPIVSLNDIAAISTRVYNLHTAEPHTYFANGIAVHNMSGDFGASFVDVSNETGIQRIQFSQTAPQWRIVEPGV